MYADGAHRGIHGVLVPIRDENMQTLPGVTIDDMGHKIALNGVDNAKLTFDNVRVPRENLLNRYWISGSVFLKLFMSKSKKMQQIDNT